MNRNVLDPVHWGTLSAVRIVGVVVAAVAALVDYIELEPSKHFASPSLLALCFTLPIHDFDSLPGNLASDSMALSSQA